MATTADLSGDGGDDDQRDSEVSVCPPMMTRDSSGPTVEGENTPRSESTPSEGGRTPRGSFLPRLKLTPRGRRSTLGDGKDRRGTGSSDSGGGAAKPSVATLAAGVLDAVGDVAELAAENAVNITATLRNDLEGVTEVLENHLEFPFLAKETHPMHGLQDWSTAVWARQIEKNPELSALLAKVLCDVPDDGSIRIEPIELATQVKAALRQAQPLSKWRTVIAFQNAILNSSHNLDNETEAFYIAPELLSTAVFRRDFPLGVDKRVAQYRWKFAIENSGLAEIRHRESKGVTIGIYLLLVFLIVATIAYLLNYTVGAPEDWTMDSTEQDTSRPSYMADVARRTKNRGAVASILTSFTFGAAVNSSLDKFGKIDPATSTVLV